MADLALSAVVALATWWLGTGVVLHLAGLAPGWRRVSIGAAGVAAVLGLIVIAEVGDQATVLGACFGFAAAILVWAWIELAFLTGLVTGPRRVACDPDVVGLRRGWQAFRAIQHHEFALVGGLAAVALAAGDGANQVATWTFALLWALRLSAKLNLFCGVPMPQRDFLPDRLRYLGSYFREAPATPLLPASLVACVVVTVLLAAAAIDAHGFRATAFGLLASLAALAVVEHAFLLLPVPAARLWGWAFRSRRRAALAAAPIPLPTPSIERRS
jgi:putative photosynthetic complex assembly protein 2